MDQQLDTAQRRAEAYVSQYEAWIKQQPSYIAMPTKLEKDKLRELFQQARIEALRDASLVIPSNWLDPRLSVVRTASCPEIEQLLNEIRQAIDRLREGVE